METPDQEATIKMFEGLIKILHEEWNDICSALKDKDKDFLVELLKTHATILNEDLFDICKYVEKKYGIPQENTDAHEMIQFLTRDVKAN
jgi:hypothetical protein